MLFKLQPILYSLIFAGVLEFVVYRERYFLGAAIFLILFSLLVVWPLARKIRFFAIPFFLSLGSLILLSLIDTQMERHVFIGIATMVYYLALLGAYRLKFYEYDLTAQGMVNFATVTTMFIWYVSNYGWYLNFQIGTWVLVVTFISSTFLISLPSLRICAAMQMRRKRDAEKGFCPVPTPQGSASVDDDQLPTARLLSSNIPTYLLINNWVIVFLNIILSLTMAEVIWALALWPFGYLTTGVVALIIFFIFWDIIRNFVQGTMSPKAMIINIVLAVLSITSVLLTTRWDLAI